MTYEEAYFELEEIVKTLQSENVDIDQSIALFKKGIMLQKHCEKILADAEDSVVNILNEENELGEFTHDKKA